MYLKSLTIKESPFFSEKIEFSFNSKLNCLMGGRGSGKTTILSVIYWALRSDEELSREQLALIKANIGSGVVDLTFDDGQGDQIYVSKTLGSSQTFKDAKGNIITQEQFRKLVKLDYFSAGSIERIGIDPKERLRIFDGFIGDKIEATKSQIGIIISQLKQNEFELKAAQRDITQLKEDLQNFGNLDEEIVKVKSEFSTSEVDAEVKAKFEQENVNQTKRTLERDFLNRAKSSISAASELRKNYLSSAQQLVTQFKNSIKFQSEYVEKFKEDALNIFETITEDLEKMGQSITLLGNIYMSASKGLTEEHQKAEHQFSELKQNIAKHRDLFQRLNTLSQKETTRKMSIDKLSKAEQKAEEFLSKRKELLETQRSLLEDRFKQRTNHANDINKLLGDRVKILIKPLAQNEAFQEVVKNILSKSQMRTTSVEMKIFESSSPSELLKHLSNNDAATYALKMNVPKDRVDELFDAIKNVSGSYELETCICEDSPNFYLAVEDKNKNESLRPTEQLSTGQRCTAVLPIIFAVTENPLLIDQPEDNLDNKYITNSIHQIIRNIKERRQLIFVTHNPNIPVISDSEYNIFLNYADQHTEISSQGNIGTVKDSIVELLEGGQQAFKKRIEFYGY